MIKKKGTSISAAARGLRRETNGLTILESRVRENLRDFVSQPSSRSDITKWLDENYSRYQSTATAEERRALDELRFVVDANRAPAEATSSLPVTLRVLRKAAEKANALRLNTPANITPEKRRKISSPEQARHILSPGNAEFGERVSPSGLYTQSEINEVFREVSSRRLSSEGGASVRVASPVPATPKKAPPLLIPLPSNSPRLADPVVRPRNLPAMTQVFGRERGALISEPPRALSPLRTFVVEEPVDQSERTRDERGLHEVVLATMQRERKWTPQQVVDLVAGVQKYGKHWESIRKGYASLYGFSGNQLKDKYRNLVK